MGTDTWNGGSGDYETASDWTNGVPGNGDTVIISASGSDVSTYLGEADNPPSGPFLLSLELSQNTTFDLSQFQLDVGSYGSNSGLFINSGTITLSAFGYISESGAQVTQNTGVINVSDSGRLDLEGTITNSGSITDSNSYANGVPLYNTGGDGVYYGLMFDYSVIKGGGSITLTDGHLGGNAPENFDNKISGSGLISTLYGFTNDAGGVVDADGSASLTISDPGNPSKNTNAGLLEATDDQGNPGVLILDGAFANSGGTIDSSAQGSVQVNGTVTGGTIEATGGGLAALNGGAVSGEILAESGSSDTGSTITLSGSAQNCTLDASGESSNGSAASIFISGTVAGGSLQSDSGGGIFARDGELDGRSSVVTNTTTLTIDGVADDRNHLVIDGTIDNRGSIFLDGATDPTALLLAYDDDGGATLGGGGTVVLSDGGGAVIDALGRSETLTNVDNTISGDGALGQSNLIVVNKHLIDATGHSPLFVDLNSATASVNSGTMEATGGGDLQLIAGLLTNSGIIAAGRDSSVEFGKSAKITNTGVLEAVRGGSVTIGGAAHNAGAFHNTGTVQALAASSVAIGLGAVSNIAGVVLTGGTWEAAGAGATVSFADGFTSDKGSLVLDSTGSVIQDGGVSLEAKLTDIAVGGVLSIRDSRAYTTTNALTVEGILQFVNAGTFKSGTITAAASSLVSGTGTLASNLTTSGRVNAAGGTLTLTGTDTLHGAIIGGAGTLTLKGTTTLAAATISGATRVAVLGKTIASGTVTLGQTSGSTTTAGLLAVGAGGTLDLSGTASIALVSGSLDNAGSLEKTGTGTGKVGLALANSGALLADGGVFDLAGAVSGTGKATIEGGGTLEFDAAVASTQALSFSTGGGKLLLDDAAAFAGSIASFAAGDTLDIGHFGKGTTATYTANTKNTGGTLTIKNGSTSANLTLVGAYAPTGFHVATGTAGDTLITYSATAHAAVAKTETAQPAIETQSTQAPATTDTEFVHALFDAAFGHAPIASFTDNVHGPLWSNAAISASDADLSHARQLPSWH